MFRILVIAVLVALPVVLASLIFSRAIAGVVLLIALGIVISLALRAWLDKPGP